MERIISERAKWISRTLAAISAILGFQAGFTLLQYVFSTPITLSPGVLLFGFLMTVIAVSLCSFFFWLAVRLWTDFEQKHIRLWALIPAIIVYTVVSLWVEDSLKSIITEYVPDVDFIHITTGFSAFIGLLAAGISYLWIKRLLFFLLEQTEIIDTVRFRKNRQTYFRWLSIFFWSMLMSVFMFLEMNDYINSRTQFWYPFTALIIPLFSAWLFYKLCQSLFITRSPDASYQPE